MRKELRPESGLLACSLYDLAAKPFQLPAWNTLSENKKRLLTLLTSKLIEKTETIISNKTSF